MPASPDHVLNALEQKDARGRIVGNGGKLTRDTIEKLRVLITYVGAGGRGPQVYVVNLWRYYLGKAPAPKPPRLNQRAPDGTDLDDWLKVRAWEVLEEHEGELPPLDYTRKPKGAR